MIEYAKDLNLNLPLRSTDMDALFRKRDLELRRYIFLFLLPSNKGSFLTFVIVNVL